MLLSDKLTELPHIFFTGEPHQKCRKVEKLLYLLLSQPQSRHEYVKHCKILAETLIFTSNSWCKHSPRASLRCHTENAPEETLGRHIRYRLRPNLLQTQRDFFLKANGALLFKITERRKGCSSEFKYDKYTIRPFTHYLANQCSCWRAVV